MGTVALDMDYDDLARLARAALIVAAQRRSLLTYGDLGQAIDWDPNVPLSHHMKRILDRVSETCTALESHLWQRSSSTVSAASRGKDGWTAERAGIGKRNAASAPGRLPDKVRKFNAAHMSEVVQGRAPRTSRVAA